MDFDEKYSHVDLGTFSNETNRLYDLTPKTIEEHVLCYLVKNGMFAKDAHAILEEYKQDCPAMKQRWNDSVDGYDTQLMSIIMAAIDAVALRHIDKNIPEAWFKPLFEK